MAPSNLRTCLAQNLDSLIAKTPFLPPAFEFIPRLLLLLDDPDFNCDALVEIIRADAGLTANVLQISNSASYRRLNRTDRLSDAVIRIGLHEIFRIVATIVTEPALSSSDPFRSQRIGLWRHSLATAVASQSLARHLAEDDSEFAFTAGLLHDIGKVVLVHAAGPDYVHLLESCAESGRSVHTAEREEFKVDHAQAADRLMRAWKFPDRIVAAVGGHHAPLQLPKPFQKLGALIYAGNILAYRIGEGNGHPPYYIQPDVPTLALINLEPENLRGYEEEVLENLRIERERFSL